MLTTGARNPGYRYAGETIDVEQALSKTQFRTIERILGEQPQRFKSWCNSFCFQPIDRRRAATLLDYLHEQRLRHSAEVRESWNPPGRRDIKTGIATDTDCEAAGVNELVAFATQCHVRPERLDEQVHDAASEQAAEINNDGLDAQIEYLLARLGIKELRRRLEHASYTEALL
jgi:hypothetical protein